jgi:hypothetical protein
MKRKYTQKNDDIYFLNRRNKIVERNKNRKAGEYLIGPEIQPNGPIENISHYLARKEGSRDFYQLKVSNTDYELHVRGVFVRIESQNSIEDPYSNSTFSFLNRS